MIKLRIKRNLMLMQQGCQSLSAKVSIMVHWMPLQRVKITEKEGIILDCTLHLESTLQQVIINGSCQSGCPNCSFFLRQKFEQLSLLQLSESKRWACRASVIYKSRLHWCGKSERFFKFHIFLDSFHAVQPLKKVTLQVKSHKKKLWCKWSKTLCYSFPNLRAALNATFVSLAFTRDTTGGCRRLDYRQYMIYYTTDLTQ